MRYMVKEGSVWGWFDLPDWFEHNDKVMRDNTQEYVVVDYWWNRKLRNWFGEKYFPKALKEIK